MESSDLEQSHNAPPLSAAAAPAKPLTSAEKRVWAFTATKMRNIARHAEAAATEEHNVLQRLSGVDRINHEAARDYLRDKAAVARAHAARCEAKAGTRPPDY